MKKFLFGLLCLAFFIVGFVLILAIRMVKVKTQVTQTPGFTPTPLDFKLEPPVQSLIGKVIRIEGGATKLTRDEDQPVIVQKDMMILEAEQINASESGSVDLQFATNDLFSMSPNAILAFPSTNPKNFLVKQDRGVVVYQTDDQIATISARSLHALFSLSQGKAQVSVDPDKKMIELTVASGSAQVGYIDKKNITKTADILTGQTVTYDDVKRTVKIK